MFLNFWKEDFKAKASSSSLEVEEGEPEDDTLWGGGGGVDKETKRVRTVAKIKAKTITSKRWKVLRGMMVVVVVVVVVRGGRYVRWGKWGWIEWKIRIVVEC